MSSLLLWLVLAGSDVSYAAKPADAGYAAYNARDYRNAIALFEEAVNSLPQGSLQRSQYLAQVGYAYNAIGNTRKAADAFRRAIDGLNAADQSPYDETMDPGSSSGRTNKTPDPTLLAYRREVQMLEKEFSVTGYTVYRDNALAGIPLATAGPTLQQSQGGIDAAWRLPKLGYRDGRLLHIFGRLMWGYDGDRMVVRPESWQGSLGMRWKPLKAHNLVLSGERLIAIGDDARNEWMLRASYSWDRGYGPDFGKKQWTYITFYADTAVIDPADPDVFLFAEGKLGQSYRVMGKGFGPALVITPHAVVTSSLQNDSYATTSLVEAGPGVSLKLHFGDNAYRAHNYSLELLAQYRIKIAGDSAGPSGPVVTLVLQY